MDERVHLARIFRRQVLVDVEILHGAADSGRKRAGIKVVNEADTGNAVAYVVPSFIQLVAYRRDNAHAGNDDTSFFQC